MANPGIYRKLHETQIVIDEINDDDRSVIVIYLIDREVKVEMYLHL